MKCGIFLFALLFSFGPANLRGQPTSSNLMAGKVKTDRTISLETTVNGTPAEVYNLWIAPQSIKNFLGAEAKIDPVPGGEYTVLFNPKVDATGENYGSKGARVLRADPGKELAFEWTTFILNEHDGVPGPPVNKEERLKRPMPTWVEIQFEPLSDTPAATRVRLSHFGFNKGGQWDQSFSFFQRAWATVLYLLQAYCERLQ